MLKFCGNEISYSILIYLTEFHFSWTLFWKFVNLNIQVKKKLFFHFKMPGKLKNVDSHSTKSYYDSSLFQTAKAFAIVLCFSMQINIKKNLPGFTI